MERPSNKAGGSVERDTAVTVHGEAKSQPELKSPLRKAGRGATIVTVHRDRRQEVIAVNRNDLADMRAFHAIEAVCINLGQFLTGGSLWLGIDKYSSMVAGEKFPSIIIVCGAAFILGIILDAIGFVHWKLRQHKISGIFDETEN